MRRPCAHPASHCRDRGTHGAKAVGKRRRQRNWGYVDGTATAANLRRQRHERTRHTQARPGLESKNSSDCTCDSQKDTLGTDTPMGENRGTQDFINATMDLQHEKDNGITTTPKDKQSASDNGTDNEQSDGADESDDDELQAEEDAGNHAPDLPDLPDHHDCVEEWQPTLTLRSARRRHRTAARSTQQCGWRGSHLWVVKLNANGLCSTQKGKITALKVLLGQKHMFGRAYPDIVVISELDMPAGTPVRLDTMLGSGIK